jgi:hypothetical protein
VLILWPRGHFKSTAVVVLAVQAILCNPDIRILLMQGTIKVTKNLLGEIASHFDGSHSRSKLRELFPEFCGNKKRVAAKFQTGLQPRHVSESSCSKQHARLLHQKASKPVSTMTLASLMTLVNDGNYRNPELLAKVEEDFNMARPLVDPGCPRFVSGTRYAFGDLVRKHHPKQQRRVEGKR